MRHFIYNFRNFTHYDGISNIFMRDRASLIALALICDKYAI